MSKILGLDLGTNSIGWAIVEKESAETDYKLLDKGVDIFQEGVKIEKGIESSKAAERTGYRSARRRLFRRKLRKIETLKVLVKYHYCPSVTQQQLNDWRYKDIYPINEDFILWQRTDDNKDKNPYYDRYLSLTKKLDLSVEKDRFLLGRALYHISQRRGFLSNRLESTKESEGAVKEGISELDKDIQQAGCSYLGEYFYKCYHDGVKIRKRYTSRKEHYEKEFNAICKKQELAADVIKELCKAIFYQRPLKSQKGTVGHCTFEPSKSRCPSSHPRFEEFRMLCFINNIKIKTPDNSELRKMNKNKIDNIKPLFFRKSKKQFEFEDIAKKLSGRNNYVYYKDKVDKPYKFNYRMSTSVSGCVVTAQLMDVFGEDWVNNICSVYTSKKTSKGIKTNVEIINDIWHALFFFDDEELLARWSIAKIGLDEITSKKFASIKIPNDYAALSLCAIDKILPFLRIGLLYSHSVFLANMSKVVPADKWKNEENRNEIIKAVKEIVNDFKSRGNGDTTEKQVKDFLLDNFELPAGAVDLLYHPSMIDIFPDAQQNEKGIYQLGSPRTSSIRNPMAMRTLFRLRVLINKLLREKEIDKTTKVHIECARELNDANMRKAIETYQRNREKENLAYKESIAKLYKQESGKDIEPTDTDVLKYRLWEEQKHKCLYTGDEIRVSDFIGADPKYDIEHTIPRSVGGDDSIENKTLCQNKFNREKKGAKIPSQLPDYSSILTKIDAWKLHIEELIEQINGLKSKAKGCTTKEAKDSVITKRHILELEKNYWVGKYKRFTMTEIPVGFRKNQDIDNSVIAKYAREYLKSVFDSLYSVKGITTSEFRKIWGLQEQYEKKSRVSHLNHAVDAITIACVGPAEYSEMARYYHNAERRAWYKDVVKAQIHKPWPTFTEDVKAIEDETLVSHYTADNMSKATKRKMRVRGKIQYNEKGDIIYLDGDSARGRLHQETFYGAIKREDEIKYVVRKSIESLEIKDLDKIVDDVVREKVKKAVDAKGIKQAVAEGILKQEEKKIPIKKVRIFTPSVTSPIHLKKHREMDLSKDEYKQDYYVANDSNYLMAIYEGTDERGKVKRDFKLFTNLEAAKYFKEHSEKEDIAPLSSESGLPLKYKIKIGTMVLLYEKSPEELYNADVKELSKRLYKVIGMSTVTVQKKYFYGALFFKYHQEARVSGDLKAKTGIYKINEEIRPVIEMLHTQLFALIEGKDFILDVDGKVIFN